MSTFASISLNPASHIREDLSLMHDAIKSDKIEHLQGLFPVDLFGRLDFSESNPEQNERISALRKKLLQLREESPRDFCLISVYDSLPTSPEATPSVPTCIAHLKTPFFTSEDILKKESTLEFYNTRLLYFQSSAETLRTIFKGSLASLEEQIPIAAKELNNIYTASKIKDNLLMKITNLSFRRHCLDNILSLEFPDNTEVPRYSSNNNLSSSSHDFENFLAPLEKILYEDFIKERVALASAKCALIAESAFNAIIHTAFNSLDNFLQSEVVILSHTSAPSAVTTYFENNPSKKIVRISSSLKDCGSEPNPIVINTIFGFAIKNKSGIDFFCENRFINYETYSWSYFRDGHFSKAVYLGNRDNFSNRLTTLLDNFPTHDETMAYLSEEGRAFIAKMSEAISSE